MFPKVLFSIGGIPIKDTVVETWIVIAVLAGLAIWSRNKFRVWEPKGWQLAIEYLMEYVDNLSISMSGRSFPDIIPFLTTMIAFVAISNVLGMLPVFQAPTRDLNTTAALSLISLGACQVFGIRKRGLKKYMHTFIEPTPLMLPMTLMSQLSSRLSMALRLFGNVMAGEVIGAVMFMLLPVLAPLPLNILSLITSILQALVFTVLTLVYVIEAIGTQEKQATVSERKKPSSIEKEPSKGAQD